jgi:hypothetical protein
MKIDVRNYFRVQKAYESLVFSYVLWQKCCEEKNASISYVFQKLHSIQRKALPEFPIFSYIDYQDTFF